MDRRFAYFIFVGLVIGALVGTMWSAGRNSLLGVWLGALIGAAVGWFYAAYRSQKTRQ